MGIGVSHWPLARAVSSHGQLGVVSGTALDVLLVRRLQDGDPGGHVRRALAQLPIQGAAARIVSSFFLPNGRPPGQPYRAITMTSVQPPHEAVERIIAADNPDWKPGLGTTQSPYLSDQQSDRTSDRRN